MIHILYYIVAVYTKPGWWRIFAGFWYIKQTSEIIKFALILDSKPYEYKCLYQET